MFTQNKANCEHDLKNTNNEFEAYINSARLFKEAGNVNATIFSYRKALEACPIGKKNAYYLEFGRFFESHNRYIEAADIYKESGYLKRAAHSYLSKLADAFIHTKFHLLINVFPHHP